MMLMKLYLGADHRGFVLKEALKRALMQNGYDVEDVGAFAQDPNERRGVLVCGSAMGMDVVANKIKGIRATVAYSKESAAHARTNDDINIITLAGDVVDFNEAMEIVTIFLTTQFSGE